MTTKEKDDPYYKGPEHREYFRLKYQKDERPLLSIRENLTGKQHSYSVIDISEKGVRFHYTHGIVENPVKGSFQARHAKVAIPIEGDIVRISSNDICLKLTNSIEWSVLMKEQRYLQKKYGDILVGDKN